MIEVRSALLQVFLELMDLAKARMFDHNPNACAQWYLPDIYGKHDEEDEAAGDGSNVDL